MYPDANPPVPAELAREIEAIEHRHLDAFGLERVDITAAHDHDGDPVILVEVHHTGAHSANEDDRVSAEALAADKEVWERATRMGESRFVHIRHKFPEEEEEMA